MSEEQEKQESKKSTKDTILGYVVWVGAVVLLAWFLITFVAQRTDVNGTSMVPTLEDGDQLICDKISYRFRDPERFDIIIFPYQYQKNTYFIKRVIGLPGETVRIDYDGNIYINGEILNEKYGLEKMAYPGIAEQEITLGDDEYFVLGDNRNVSEDSRYPDVGLIKRKDIIGRAWLRIYPFSKFGLITHDLGADNLDTYSGLSVDEPSGTLSTASD
ncbi:MAG: signal peptidase I [Lachnospiraceae bacterium]|jgi:signal peptidase I|nr:signal peptidase I [Lachnospiraceae bacterium]